MIRPLRGSLRCSPLPPGPGAVVMGLVLLTAGCDPCSGVVACTSGPRIALEGELVENHEGAPASRAIVDVLQVGGPPMDRDSIRTHTDAAGRFTVEGQTSEAGDVVVDILVQPESERPYRVTGLRLPTTNRRGSGHILPRWVTRPYFAYHGELFLPGTGERIRGAQVTFRRTGGVRLYGAAWRSDRYSAISDRAGRFTMFHGVYSSEIGELRGDLTVRPAGADRSYEVKGVRLVSTQVANAPITVIALPVGPALNWVGEFYYRDTGEPASGVLVEFRQTGGVPVQPANFTATTNDLGRVLLNPHPQEEGEVVFELRLELPAPYHQATLSGLRMQTNAEAEFQLLGSWGVGAHLAYVGELLWADTYLPAEGVEVEFRRTGGIEVTPDTFIVHTDTGGRFPLSPRPLEQTGDVTFELVVRPGEGSEPFIIGGLSFSPHEEDAARLYGVWTVPRE